MSCSPRRLPSSLPAGLALVLLLSACSADMTLKEANDADAGGDTGSATEPLRLNVYPSDATAALEPQSIEIDAAQSWSGLVVELSPSVELKGHVEAFLSTPTATEVTVPGEDAPLAARIELLRTDSIAGGSTSTNGSGDFSITVPPGQGYQLRILPEESDRVPFELQTIPVLASDLDMGLVYLDYGAPVWGQVSFTDGTSPTGARVHLVDVDSGASGPLSTVDEDGWYMLRAYPGDYLVVVEGRDGTSVPTVRERVIFDDDIGARVDVSVGPNSTRTVEGFLQDGQGGALSDIRVRASSLDLRDVDGDLVVTDETADGGGGRFALDLLPGSWRLEVIPPYEGLVSAQTLELTVGDADIDLGDVILEDRLPYSALIQDPGGAAVIDVLVVARELGYDGYTYSAMTGPDGRIELELPRGEMEFTLTPSGTDLAVTTTRIDPMDEESSILTLSEGRALNGDVTSEGEPVPFAVIEVQDSLGRLLGTALTNEEGHFQMRIVAD